MKQKRKVPAVPFSVSLDGTGKFLTCHTVQDLASRAFKWLGTTEFLQYTPDAKECYSISIFTVIKTKHTGG